MSRVAGLLLAAGASTRMKRPKQLLPLGDTTLLDLVLEETLKSELSLVTLVLGFQASRIRKGLKTDLHDSKLLVIENNRYLEGISSSIVAGLSEVENSHDHVMIILADMPHLTSGVIDHLLYRYFDSGLPLGAIKIAGRRSHPVIISRPFYGELRKLRGDVGARDLFDSNADLVCLVEAERGYQDSDLDTMEDYLHYRESLKKNGR